MNKRKTALLTGWAIVLMAILAGFCFGYAFPEFNQSENPDSLQHFIQTKLGLYILMLIGLFMIVLLDLIVTYTLFKYFEEVSRKISLIAAISRMLYTFFFGAALYFLLGNIANDEVSNLLINQNYRLFESIWGVGLVIFGFHLVLIGYLMMLENVISKLLVYLMFLAGASYVVMHLLKLVPVNLKMLANLEMVLAFPMAIGELGLAIWLIIKGGKTTSEEHGPNNKE